MPARPKNQIPVARLKVKRRKITVTFVNGVQETFEATSTPAQDIRNLILKKGQSLETEQMFREASEKWPVVIPGEELLQPFTGIKPRKAEEKQQ